MSFTLEADVHWKQAVKTTAWIVFASMSLRLSQVYLGGIKCSSNALYQNIVVLISRPYKPQDRHLEKYLLLLFKKL